MGLPLKERMQGNRKCRCKVRGAHMGEARWDPHGTHLAAGCAWGGWRTKQHGDIATVVVEWINAAGGRAHEITIGHIPTQEGTKKGWQRAARHYGARDNPGPSVNKPTRRNNGLRCGSSERNRNSQ